MSGLDKLHNTLASFRRMIRLWYLTTGFCYVIVSIGLVIFLSLFLDRLFRFDWSQRLICLLIGVSYICFNIYHYVIQPMLSEISDEYLCLSIEKRRPEFTQKITSGYQLANLDQPEVYGYSTTLVDATINECVTIISQFNTKELIDHKLKYKLYFCGIVSVGLFFMFSYCFANEYSIWFHRNILLENVKWPRKTILTISNMAKGNKIFVPEGDPFELKVQANSAGNIPELIEIKISKDDKENFVTTNLMGINNYLYRFEKVSSNFSLVVFGGDDESEVIHIVTIEKPEIKSIKFKCEVPSYTGQSSFDLSIGQSSWIILENSNLLIDGIANKALGKTDLYINGVLLNKSKATINGEQFSLSIKGEEMKSGTYEIKVYDENGITKEPGLIFSISVQPDKLPEVGLKLDYASDIVTPQAIINNRWLVKDDYGVKNANIVLSVLSKEEKSDNSKKLKLIENTNKLIKTFDGNVNLQLPDYQLVPSQQILIYLEASDFCIRTPEVLARSSVTRLTVVSVEEFEKFVFDKEQELRSEIERLIKEEESIQIVSASVLENIKLRSTWGNNEIKEMMNVEKKQKMMEQRNLRVVTRFDQLLNDIKVNNIVDENMNNKKRIESKIQNPLNELNEKFIPIALSLSVDMRIAENLPQKVKIIKELIGVQSSIIAQYAEILKAMRKWEGYYETVGLLKEIIKEQKNLKDQTEKKTKENIKGVFDE